MRTIVEFINEALTGKAKGCLWTYADWRDYLNDESSWEDFAENTLDELRPADQKKVKDILDDVKKNMIKCGRVFLGNWGEGYYDDMDEAWDYFYAESGCKKRNFCINMFQDGDDGDYYYVEFKKNVDPKLVDDFKALFSDDVWFNER